MNYIPSVCPVSVIPQRRKRRRANPPVIKSEPIQYVDQAPYTPQLIDELNESPNNFYDNLAPLSSSASSSLSASPIQELGYTDEIFPSIGEIFGNNEKIKFIQDFPSIDDITDMFGFQNTQQFPLLTPTMSSLSFFA